MKSILVSQCKKSFNFHPLQPWPSHLPAYSWEEELLTGFNLPADHQVINLSASGSSIEKIMSAVYPQLSLAELARLHQLAALTPEQFRYLLEQNSLRPSEALIELLVKLSQTPIDFQNWTSERKLGAKELYILKSVGSVIEISPLLDALVEFKASRQIGVQILENAIELFLLKSELPTPKDGENLEAWGQRLFQLRHPLQAEKILTREKNILSLAWPKFLKVRVVEHQASLVNEVKLQFRSPGELLRNIEALKKIHHEINQTIENQNL
jgi:hypothetical protein